MKKLLVLALLLWALFLSGCTCLMHGDHMGHHEDEGNGSTHKPSGGSHSH